MPIGDELESLIYHCLDSRKSHYASGTINLYENIKTLGFARDLLLKEHGGLLFEKNYGHHNPSELYLINTVIVERPCFHNDTFNLEDLEYALKLSGPADEFPDNVNAMAEELGITVFIEDED